MNHNPFVGKWTYRSLLNNPDLKAEFKDLEFGRGTLEIREDDLQLLTGVIGGDDWSLTLKGMREYGTPMRARFQGVGNIKGEQWIYDYEGYLVSCWPNGVQQRPAIVGSVIRTIPHTGGSPGSVAPAGVVASFYAVKAE